MIVDERKIKDFLLTNNFDISKGYSYNELLNFIKAYKGIFIACYDAKERYKREIIQKDKTKEDYDNRIKELTEQNKKLQNLNNILTNNISRKLTLKERLFGRFIWDNKI